MRLISTIAALLLTASASAAEAPIRVEDATVMWVPAIGQIPRAGFMRVTNTSDEAVELVGARSGYFASVDFKAPPDGDVVIMEDLDMPQTIAPGETLVFEHGGRHMLMSVESGPLRPGNTVDIDLLFDGYDDKTVTFTVRKRGENSTGE
jgi:copper(I)-binding protein